ncbi:hypothetical protein ANN_00812 [Periplaneta americana]|uniref:Uncharacterized protein n=1 Tax=Periplaneta americana TaxID=6978 RepID=A0ABQ8TRT7_PERAM|nr:hypothetical protein ANN_00812 [Periplaneta americana]
MKEAMENKGKQEKIDIKRTWNARSTKGRQGELAEYVDNQGDTSREVEIHGEYEDKMICGYRVKWFPWECDDPPSLVCALDLDIEAELTMPGSLGSGVYHRDMARVPEAVRDHAGRSYAYSDKMQKLFKFMRQYSCLKTVACSCACALTLLSWKQAWRHSLEHFIIGPFFFIEATVTENVYLDMSQNFFVDQLLPESVFQQHGAPPHFYGALRCFLNANFPNNLIGRGEPLLGHLGQPA